MRLKATPEDFQVREATELRIKSKPAPYQVYMLEKRGWNTTDALMRIAKEHRAPYARFSYGGKKDRHALTFQYVTFQGDAKLKAETEGYRLRALGYADEPMTPAKILANHFTLTLREVTPVEVATLQAGVATLREAGSVNYFDDQRFGHYDRERGLIGEKLLQQRWDDALNMALTSIHPEEHREAKSRKRALRERWGDWAACRELAETALEQRAFDRLRQEPAHATGAAAREILATVHPETVNLWIAAYQSYLWNETVRRLVQDWAPAVRAAHGVAGDYLFPSAPVPALRELVVPLPGRGMRFATPGPKVMLQKLLREREVAWSALEQGEVLPGFVFKASPREAVVVPQALKLDGPQPDELYPGKQKLTLAFSLPKGAYATMVVKAMLANVVNTPMGHD